MNAPEPFYSCSACGATVRRCFTPSDGWSGWQHVDASEEADCADARGDRPWEPRMSARFSSPIQ